MKMKAIVVIPARYGSTRLSAKMLLKKTGKYLVQHTYERVVKCRNVARIIIAADDSRVAKAVRSFGAEVMMTSPKHTCGTERIAEVVRKLPLGAARYVVNVQGDEPEIDPAVIDRLILALSQARLDMATLACPLKSERDWTDPNKVKVTIDANGFALSFRRVVMGAIPNRCYRHLGVYGYKRASLLRFDRLAQTESEKVNRLEQLRAMENNFRIKVLLADKAPYGIDTKDDYDKFVKRVRR
jgi:3-deoxy-manno-octulosonate cytidylyltransferase (CMP-KDO synthetase)